eukprot:CAMPEP_0176486460 /NCGR_PEP_ID=MMETSP0200_2-20121128/5578_1 /TAXON_ID=947934 /ORGANISM="Chaetoceros sp., Strain GSL56" /LENGTH=729 /DNA_ID=CAMNT_0017883159 /DNA_START=252 /DNA_END=2441 /DNA_ORIENTATION=+
MSLGYARDSIADLQSLHNLEKEDPDTTTAPSSYYLRGHQTSQEEPRADDYYYCNLLEEDALFIEEEEQEHFQGIKVPAVPLDEPSLQVCKSESQCSNHSSPLSVATEEEEHAATTTTTTTTITTPTTTIILEETTELLNDDGNGDGPQTGTRSFASTSNRTRVNKHTLAKEESKKQTTNYSYSGFDYSDYYQDSYLDEFGTRSSKKNKNILCCLFPFLQDPLLSDDEEDEEQEEGESTVPESLGHNEMGHAVPLDETKKVHSLQELGENIVTESIKDAASDSIGESIREVLSLSPSSSTSDTDLSFSSNGDHFDCQVQASSVTHMDPTLPKNNETHNTNISIETESNCSIKQKPTKSIKGILKHTVIKPQLPTKPERHVSTLNTLSKSPSDKNGSNIKRRSILPTYESSVVHKSSTLDESSERSQYRKSVTFSSMARVVPVLPRSEMSYYLKSMIWWQRADYEDFKKAGRIISKAMLQGGSEIWLQTSDAWGKKRENRIDKNLGSVNQNEQASNSEEYSLALRKYGVNDQSEEKVIEDDIDDVGDNPNPNKWWCKFGHSRRGLEHIASVDEGRQRQKLVNASITAVLEEQRRQRLSRRDPNKIAAISMQYTSWAKDLARAAGEADAEAVRSNFHSKAKGRLSYLSSRLLKRKDGEQVEGQPCASFILSANPALMAEVLDSHAHDFTNGLRSSAAKVRADMLVNSNTHSESKNDIAHKAAGFQFQQAAPA